MMALSRTCSHGHHHPTHHLLSSLTCPICLSTPPPRPSTFPPCSSATPKLMSATSKCFRSGTPGTPHDIFCTAFCFSCRVAQLQVEFLPANATLCVANATLCAANATFAAALVTPALFLLQLPAKWKKYTRTGLFFSIWLATCSRGLGGSSCVPLS